MERIVEFETDVRAKLEEESICEYYLSLRENELEEGTKQGIENAWRRLEEYLEETNSKRKNDNRIGFGDLSKERVLDFVEWYRRRENVTKDSMVKKDVERLSAMVNWFNSRGVMTGNPFRDALDTSPFNDTTPDPKIEIQLDALRDGIADIQNPILLVTVVTLLKTGLRIGELVNLDERDIHLDHPISGSLDDPRTKIKNKPDSIYIDSSISAGKKKNGEVRSDPNKPDSTRIIPLDPEVKKTLIWYLAMRPTPKSVANPILVWNNGDKGRAGIGFRTSAAGIRSIFNNWADEHGWYSVEPHSMKPHWCRHWFTTILRTNLDEDLIEIGTADDYEDFLRGDTSSSTKDKYLQMNWGDGTWMTEALDDALPEILTSKVND